MKNWILISNPYNIAYLTGFLAHSKEERESFVLLEHEEEQVLQLIHLVPAMLFPLVKTAKFKSIEVNLQKLTAKSTLVSTIEQLVKNGNLFIEADDLRVFEKSQLKKKLGGMIKLKDLKTNFLNKNREIKESQEISTIKKACGISQKAFEIWQSQLVAGITERQAYFKLTRIIEDLGAEIAFPAIIAFGKHSASPHHTPSNSKLHENEIVLVDWGAKIDNYCSDFTRTFIFAPSESISDQNTLFTNRYKIVENSLKSIVSQAKAGTKISKLMEILDSSLGELSKYQLHSLGHGIGLEVHENPYLGRLSNREKSAKLQLNSIVAIEPGIYFPNWGGIRIENTYLVTEYGLVAL